MGVSSAAETLTLGSATGDNATQPDAAVTDGSDITAVNSWGYSPTLWTSSDRFKLSEHQELLTAGSSAYDLLLNTSYSAYNFAVGQSIYLNTFSLSDTNSTNITSLTIDFGESGSITTTNQFNIGQGLKAEGSCFTIKATGNTSESLNRVLVSANAFWNVSDANQITVEISGMEGLTNLGVVDSEESISEGQYGIVRTTNTLTLVSKIASAPEPASASLGLIALGTLILRRRRA